MDRGELLERFHPPLRPHNRPAAHRLADDPRDRVGWKPDNPGPNSEFAGSVAVFVPIHENISASAIEPYTHRRYMRIPRPSMSGPHGDEALIQENKPKLLNRLSRIEGQVRGIARMVDGDRYCIDILTQLQAVRSALARVETELLKAHLDHCIESAIVSGDQAEQRRKATELIELLERTAR